MSAVVEKNPDANIEGQEQEKAQKKKQKNRNFLNFNKKNDEKNMPNKGHGQKGNDIIEKSKEPISVAGSNFDIMNPVCGVNLTEDKKTKSGGKDFFHKYNKFSLQVFEETLNKTINANFYQSKMETIINNTMSNNVMSLKKRKKTIRELLDQTNKDSKNIIKII